MWINMSMDRIITWDTSIGSLDLTGVRRDSFGTSGAVSEQVKRNNAATQSGHWPSPVQGRGRRLGSRVSGHDGKGKTRTGRYRTRPSCSKLSGDATQTTDKRIKPDKLKEWNHLGNRYFYYATIFFVRNHFLTLRLSQYICQIQGAYVPKFNLQGIFSRLPS